MDRSRTVTVLIGVARIGGADVEATTNVTLPGRVPLVGLVARSMQVAEKPEVRPCIHATVVSFEARSIWDGTRIVPAGRDEVLRQLDWAHREGLPVRARQLWGKYSPRTLLLGAKGMTYVGGDRIRVPWTVQAHGDYEEGQAAIAGAVGDHPALSEITLSCSMIEYAEVFIRAFNEDGNRVSARDAGWTLDGDMLSILEGARAHSRVWSPLGVNTTISHNPAQVLTLTDTAVPSWRGDVTVTLSSLTDTRATLGASLTAMNNSLIPPRGARGADYDLIYDRFEQIHAEGARVAVQSATSARILDRGQGGLQATVDVAAGFGASSLEVPTDAVRELGMTPTFAARALATFRAVA